MTRVVKNVRRYSGRALRALSACAATLLALPLSGCGGQIVHAIVSTRSQQGDIAYDRGNLVDAAQQYRLALQLAPNDEHARAGMAAVQLRIAARDYLLSKFEDADAALAVAQKYDPDSVRLADLKAKVEQARTRQRIVTSNYPAYKETAAQLQRSYQQLSTLDAEIVKTLKRFDYTYDSANLTAAIRQSTELGSEVSKLTARLGTLRTLVESGGPERSAASQPGSGSLLPLP